MISWHKKYLLQILIVLSILVSVGIDALALDPPYEDPNPAMNNPDKFAWDLFMEVNRPALLSAGMFSSAKRGVPDPDKTHGDSGLRVWETWKITTEKAEDVFLPNGERPQEWEKFDMKVTKEKQLSPPQGTFAGLDLAGKNPHTESLREAPRLDKIGQESRINQRGFDYIVKEHLYSLDGQECFRKTGRKVEFPLGTINVKAAWRQFTLPEIETGVPNRFYTAKVSSKEQWGLTGFHITSKDLPNWFWATFEQVDNPPPEIPDHDRYTTFISPRERVRAVPKPLQNTYWQYYVLRGTQVDFVDSMGIPTILGNTQLERGQQATSSCMGCHARSTIGDRKDNIIANGHRVHPDGSYFYPGGRLSNHLGNRLTVNAASVPWKQDPQLDEIKITDPGNLFQFPIGAIGAPNPEWFIDSVGHIRYTQMDFIWAFFHAQRESVSPCK